MNKLRVVSNPRIIVWHNEDIVAKYEKPETIPAILVKTLDYCMYGSEVLLKAYIHNLSSGNIYIRLTAWDGCTVSTRAITLDGETGYMMKSDMEVTI